MPHQDREKQREAERRWYHANKQKVLAKKKAKVDRLRALVRDAKEQPCTDCRVRYPYYVMDFDHVDGDKLMIVSKLVLRGSTSRLLQEIAKCEVVCSNCHRVRTFERLQASKPWLDGPEDGPANLQQSLF